jgi:hypothetical protein
MRLCLLAAFGVVVMLISQHYTDSIAPLCQRETESMKAARKLRERIADAEKKIAEIRVQKMDVARIRSEIDQAQADVPPGSVIESFPAWVKEHFAHFGIVVLLVHQDAARNEPNASDYERGSWTVNLPIDEAGLNVPKLLSAVADIDQRSAFVRVLEFEIRSNPEKPGGRVGFLNLATVLRK